MMVSALVLLLAGMVASMVFGAGAPRMVQAVSTPQPTVQGPWPTATRILTETQNFASLLDVHVDASANGEGSVHVVAASVGGQAVAHIDSKGAANGHAAANAPALGCAQCAGNVSLDDSIGHSTPVPAPGVGGSVGAQAEVNVDQVNLRAGPSTDDLILSTARNTERFAITGRNADGTWWRVCCAGGLEVWINAQLVRVANVNSVPVVGQATNDRRPTLPGQALTGQANDQRPTATSAAPTSPSTSPSATATLPGQALIPTPTPRFAVLRAEKQPEANNLIVYAFVHDKGGQPLEGYALQLMQNNALPPGLVQRTAGHVLGTTYAGQGQKAALDAPYNTKTAFDSLLVYPGYNPAGNWVAWLTDDAGVVVSEKVPFTVLPKDEYKQIYLEFGVQ